MPRPPEVDQDNSMHNQDPPETPSHRRKLRGYLLLWPIGWTLFLFLFLPTGPNLLWPVRVVLTLITALAFNAMFQSCRGHMRLFTLPVWMALAYLLYCVWIYPWK
jgi:hypothetical protein